MANFDIAFIGTGADPETQDNTGYSMAYRHGSAYDKLESCNLLAAADIVPENVEAFGEYFDIDENRIYQDYQELLTETKPDIVSVCTPPNTHGDIVLDCMESGVVDAVHCEKPMAREWKDCQRMARVAKETGTKLTFNHQRRFGRPYRQAKRLLDDGEIGRLERIEMAAPNIYDYGSHSIDLCNYFNDECNTDWVIGQLDYREEDRWFGVHNENQTLASWKYENGVKGLAATGNGSELINCHHRLIGTKGTIEIGHGFAEDEINDKVLRIKNDDDTWRNVDVGGEGLSGDDVDEYARNYINRAVEDIVTALEDGTRSELNSENALRATEIIFSIWHSSRKHGRVDLPLEIDDNPLDSMIETGELSPEPADD